MTCHLSLNQLAQLLSFQDKADISFSPDRLVSGINTDSRSIEPGQAFLALKGDNFNGHDFIDMAIEKGAATLIVDQPVSVNSSSNIPVFLVKNTLETYQQLGQWWRNQFTIPVIAITGSVGKTTTKELIASVLATRGKVHKTLANYNNEIGVPKTLLELDETHDSAVIEMGMRGRGEIALLAQIAQPTIAVITNVGTAHIGRLGSEAAIAEAKCELLSESPSGSIAVLNYDHPLLTETAKRVWQGETITYGFSGGDIVGELLDLTTLRVNGLDFNLPLSGRHHALNFMAALAVAKILGIDWTSLQEGIKVNLPSGRAKRYQIEPDILLLDETYNAGLESMLAALDLLKATPGQRHIAVLGTMKELGSFSEQLHRQVGERVQKLGIDRLFVLVDDPEAKFIAEAATGVACECFQTHADLINRLKEVIDSGDRILCKASHSVGLNRVVEELISDIGS
jgi:UDP-N-acetylmuramoyl-tripeptide--D-alanyl-D-alanine ligase